MGDSENKLTPEEKNEIDRILGLLPKDVAPEQPSPKRGDKAAEPEWAGPEEEYEEIPADEISVLDETAAEAPAGEAVEDITDILEFVEEPAARKPAPEMPEAAEFPAEELESAGEIAMPEEELPVEAAEAPPVEEIRERTPLEELEGLTSEEPASVDIQDISEDVVPSGAEARAPMAEEALEEIPEFAAEEAAELPEVRIEREVDLEVPDLSDISLKESAEIPVAGMEEIPEIGAGEIPEMEEPLPRPTKAAPPLEEVPDEYRLEDIPSPLEFGAPGEEPVKREKAPPPPAESFDEFTAVRGIESIEEIVKTEDIPESSMEPEEEPPPRRRREEPQAEPSGDEAELSSRDMKKLKTALLLFPSGLRRAIKETMLGDALPAKDISQLIDMIITGKPEDNIHRFLEKKLKRKIDIGEEAPAATGRRVIAARPEYTREGAVRQKKLMRMTRIFGIAALVAFLATIVSYQYIYKPAMAKRYIREGVSLIRKPGDPVTAKVRDYNKAEELFKYVDEHFVKNYIPGYNAYARAYFDKKEYELSLRKLMKARELDPVNVDTLNNLGHFYSKIPDTFYERMKPIDAKETKLDTAINFYRMALNRQPNNVTALFGIGNAYLHQGQPLKARQYYEDIVRVDPKSWVGYSGLLNLYVEKDVMPQVLTVHSELVEKELLTEVPSALLAKLASYYLSKKRTDDVNIRIDYGIQSSRFKDMADNPYPAVRAVLDALHQRDPDYPPQYLLYAKLSKDLKNLTLMESYLQKALKLEPNYFGALSMLGEYHYMVKEPVKAYEYLNKAIKASASPPDFTLDDFYVETENVGKSYFLLGNIFYYFFDKVKFRFGDELEEEQQESDTEQVANFEIARDKYEQALAEGYKTSELSYNLGRIYYMKGQYEKALEQWLDLYEDFVSRPELMIALGNAFYHLDNFDASRGEYLKLVSVLEREAENVKTVMPDRADHIRIFQTLSSAYNNLGAVYQRRNNEAKTSICYWKSIDYAKRIERENEFARVNMARAFKQRTEAIQPILDENIPFSVEVYSKEMR